MTDIQLALIAEIYGRLASEKMTTVKFGRRYILLPEDEWRAILDSLKKIGGL